MGYDSCPSGRQNYSVALSVLGYLSSEDHYVPWEAATSGLLFLYKVLMHDPIFGNLQVCYLLLASGSICAKIYNTVKFSGLDYERRE